MRQQPLHHLPASILRHGFAGRFVKPAAVSRTCSHVFVSMLAFMASFDVSPPVSPHINS
jgi:hypothetical protein